MNKKLAAAALAVGVMISVASCSGEADATSTGVKNVEAYCVGDDKLFVFSSTKKGGLAVIANHKDCVKR
jgi:hypothetical protein